MPTFLDLVNFWHNLVKWYFHKSADLKYFLDHYFSYVAVSVPTRGDFLLTVDKLVNTSKCNLDCKLFCHKIGYFTPILAIFRLAKALILHVFSI